MKKSETETLYELRHLDVKDLRDLIEDQLSSRGSQYEGALCFSGIHFLQYLSFYYVKSAAERQKKSKSESKVTSINDKNITFMIILLQLYNIL